jgi:tRNA(fMet)-specific endonuclease VapC
MRYLLDTNAIIGLLSNAGSALAQRARRERPSDIAMSAIVAHELYHGALKSQRRARNLALLDALQFAVLDLDKEDARAAGEIRASLAEAGMPIGPYDVLIAGQALARNLILVSHNAREFGRVPNLKVEDWEV